MSEDKELWKVYTVKLQVLDKLYGGLPKDPNLIEGFLKGKGLSPAEAEARAKVIAPEIDQSIPEDEGQKAEGMWAGFKKDDKGLYIETRQIKAMLKESCGESEMWKDKRKGFMSRLAGTVFPKGEGGVDLSRIYLYRDGKALTRPDGFEEPICDVGTPISQPDGFEETVGHIKGPQGPRSILKRADYVISPVIHFDLKVGGKAVSEKDLKYLFEFGQEVGLGAGRSQEKGKFQMLELKLKAAEK